MLNSSSVHSLTEHQVSDTLTPAFTFHDAVQAVKNQQPLSQAVQLLLSQLTKLERLFLLDGDAPFYEGLKEILCNRYNSEPFIMGQVPRLRIPGVRFTDGPRGVVMGASTAFPVPMARAATWDTAFEHSIGHAIGREAKAQGANYFAGVCINLPRHPAWGRIQETYGEDPILLGEFGCALTAGVQNHIMACVKHFALNSMENARFRVDVKVEDDVLHEVYLAHFRRVVEEAKVASVMSAYNSVNGEWAGQSKILLTDILRRRWKFDGFVLSDFIFGFRDAVVSVANGLDIEAPFRQQRNIHLGDAIQSGKIDWETVDRACSRILRKQLEFAVKTEASRPDKSIVFCDAHRALAREVAGRSMVLLKNEAVNGTAVLPLHPRKIARIAVVGRLANVANTGDKGSSQVFSPHVVTPFEGIKAAFPNSEVILEDTGSVEKAKEIAAMVDRVICIVGYDARDEGEYVVPCLEHDPELLDLLPPAKTRQEKMTLEVIKGGSSDDKKESGLEVGAGGDRRSLRLRPQEVELINAVTTSNPSTCVAVISAGAVIMKEWNDKVPALLFSWYSGAEGGHALADVLLGRIDASGRLPFSIPKYEAHLPTFNIEAREVQYDRWFGQALLDKLGVDAAYPFGFGLSYTSFVITKLQVCSADTSSRAETLKVSVTVKNTGSRVGRHIVQVYSYLASADRPSRMLLGFAPVDLGAGEENQVMIKASLRPLQRWVNGEFVMPRGPVDIEAAAFAGDPNRVKKLYIVTQE